MRKRMRISHSPLPLQFQAQSEVLFLMLMLRRNRPKKPLNKPRIRISQKLNSPALPSLRLSSVVSLLLLVSSLLLLCSAHQRRLPLKPLGKIKLLRLNQNPSLVSVHFRPMKLQRLAPLTETLNVNLNSKMIT